MLRKILNLFGNKVDRLPSAPSTLSRDDEGDVGLLATCNTDGMTEADQRAFWREASRRSQIPIFDGNAEHGYGVSHVADPERCPRCGGSTEVRYANLIYSTQIALRVMFAPAGHFCTKCPTVVVEEDFIKAGITDRRFHYEAVIGVDYGGKKDPDYFRTWNGEDLVYIVDEDGTLQGVTRRGRFERHAPSVAAITAKKNANKKNRNKAAKRSRRRNRKK